MGGRALILVALALLVVGNMELLCVRSLASMPPPRLAGEAPHMPAGLLHAFYFGTVDVTTNSQGLRSDEIPSPRPARELRILCLGDSQTFGVGLGPDQTWPAILGEMLARQAPAGQTIRVINAGQPGFGAEQGAALLDQVIDAYDPQVVIAVFGYDDKNLPVYGGLPTAGRRTALDRVLDWSASWRWVRRQAVRREERALEQKAAASFGWPWWERSAANMKGMHDRVKARGGHFIIGAEAIRVLDEAGSPTAPDRASYQKLEQAYAAAGQSLGTPALQINKLFSASGLPREDLFIDDLAVHVSRVGTRIIADAAAREMWKQSWVPRRSGGSR